MNYRNILLALDKREVNYCTIKNCNFVNDRPNFILRHDGDFAADTPSDYINSMLEDEDDFNAKSIIYIFDINREVNGKPMIYDIDSLKEYENKGWEFGFHFGFSDWIVARENGFDGIAPPKSRNVLPYPQNANVSWAMKQFDDHFHEISHIFDVRSYSFHGQTAIYKIPLSIDIMKHHPNLISYEFFKTNLFPKIYICDSNGLGIFVSDIGYVDELESVITRFKDGEVYHALIHPRHWDKDRNYILVKK